jgi:type I restriction enzyme, S subunit
MSDVAALPQGWRRTSIGEETEECKVRVGAYTSPPTVLSSTKHHGLVPSDDFFRNRTVYSENLSNYKVVAKDWFAYATNHLAEGSIGLQEKFDNACVSPIYTVFSCRGENDPSYLQRVLKSPELISQYKLHEQASVDRRGAVRYRDFAKICIILPPLIEQQRIAAILDTADEVIRSTEQLIAKLEGGKEGYLHDLLTRGIDGDGNLRGHDFNASAISLRFKDYPPSWQRMRIADFTRVNVGYVGPLTDYFTDDADGIPLLSTMNIGNGGMEKRGVRRVTHAFDRANAKSRVAAHDVIVARHGESGEAAVVPDRFSGAQCLNVVIIRRSTIVLSYFLATLLSSDAIRRRIMDVKAGSVQGVVNTSEISDLIIPIPPITEQRKILDCVGGYERSLAAENAELAKLLLLKRGLMDDLLTGRVRVEASR